VFFQATQPVSNAAITSIDTKTPALGQALAAASTPVVLTAAQLATLTPPAAITGFSTEATLGTILTTGTPITGQSLESGGAGGTGWLASLRKAITDRLPTALGQTTKNASLSVSVASDDDLQGKLGSLTETAPASDTASSGINGRLQRIAQRLTTLIAGVPLLASEAHLGEVGGNTAHITPTVTVSTTPAYTAGDSIGGKITLTAAVRVSGGTALLESIMILDRANQKPTGQILIYNADPAAATLTDNAAVVNSTDDQKIIAMIPVTSSDWTTINSKAYATLRNLGVALKAASGTTLYASWVVTSTPTFAATTDVQMIFGLLRD
jgi:hypothetical protein